MLSFKNLKDITSSYAVIAFLYIKLYSNDKLHIMSTHNARCSLLNFRDLCTVCIIIYLTPIKENNLIVKKGNSKFSAHCIPNVNSFRKHVHNVNILDIEYTTQNTMHNL